MLDSRGIRRVGGGCAASKGRGLRGEVLGKHSVSFEGKTSMVDRSAHDEQLRVKYKCFTPTG